MTRTILLAMAVGVALAAGCADNEVTFYIDHVKAQPAPPECSASTGDPAAPQGLIDLAFGNAYKAFYQVTNRAMVRDQSENLRAETDGIMVEGMEVYVETPEGEIIGGSDTNNFYQYPIYIEPESTDIVFADSLPENIVLELASEKGCAQLADYEEADFVKLIEDPSVPLPESKSLGFVYSVVRFLGHTNGGTEVQTPEFPFLIDMCCNCLVAWDNCVNHCSAFCLSPETATTCTPGVGGFTDCAFYSHNPKHTWELPDGGVLSCANCDETQ
jgi:hypothetical protein